MLIGNARRRRLKRLDQRDSLFLQALKVARFEVLIRLLGEFLHFPILNTSEELSITLSLAVVIKLVYLSAFICLRPHQAPEHPG